MSELELTLSVKKTGEVLDQWDTTLSDFAGDALTATKRQMMDFDIFNALVSVVPPSTGQQIQTALRRNV